MKTGRQDPNGLTARIASPWIEDGVGVPCSKPVLKLEAVVVGTSEVVVVEVLVMTGGIEVTVLPGTSGAEYAG